jgi:hypothetical protein
MDKNKLWEYVTPNGKRNSLKTNLFEFYVYLCLIWVIFALGFDLYMIIKHTL